MVFTDWKSEISESSATVDISVINTTTYIRDGPGTLLVTPVYKGYEIIDVPSYSFLIHHQLTNSQLLFDLGLRRNWKTHLSPHLLREIQTLGLTIEVEKDVADILEEHGVQPRSIDGIIFSHHHWDHTGDVSQFPASTKLIVGPGYKNKSLPGWPSDPDAVATTSDTYQGREMVELEFSLDDAKVSKIGSYLAHDCFGDGSLYVLSTPGHTKDHLSCLARTTASNGSSTFMFLGGDLAHHCSLLRPSERYPLPETLSPAPYDKLSSSHHYSAQALSSIHRAYNEVDGEVKSRTIPFCLVPDGYVDEDTAETQATVDKCLKFDGDEDIFTVLAHDNTLMGVIDFFPKLATDWKAKSWGQRSHWRFLAPLYRHNQD